MYKKIEIIAEVKTLSPFGYVADRSWEDLLQIAEKIGDIISIHTDPRWGGSFEILAKARALTKKPILAKGIHATNEEIEKAVAFGADWVLAVGRVPEVHTKQCIIEPMTLEQLSAIPKSLRVIWNARNLATGNPKPDNFDQAREIFKGWLCQASHIGTVADVNDSANAVLVGTNLFQFAVSLSNAQHG